MASRPSESACLLSDLARGEEQVLLAADSAVLEQCINSLDLQGLK
jgi:hypothetical protein